MAHVEALCIPARTVPLQFYSVIVLYTYESLKISVQKKEYIIMVLNRP